MQVKALFIGFTERRSRNTAEAIGRAGKFVMEAAVTADPNDGVDLAERFDVVFLNADIGQKALSQVVGRIRQANARLAIALTYGAEPDGRLFHLATRHDCWLFSEGDRMNRGLTMLEMAEGLRARQEAGGLRSRLMEITSSSGPCSTGK